MSLTREQVGNLMRRGRALAEKKGYYHDEYAGERVGMTPTRQIPLFSYELWLTKEQQWLTIVLLINWECSMASFQSEHLCKTWQYGCEHCKALRAPYLPPPLEEEEPKIDWEG